MPVLSLTGADAIRSLRSNATARWPKRSDAANRIEPLALLRSTPTFTFSPGATVFTIGSCFARNVEAALLNRGFRVPTRELWVNELSGKTNADSILNNYGVSSILNELRWALGEGEPFDPDKNFVEVFPNRFADIHLPSLVPLCSREVAWERRQRILSLTRQIVDADVVVITLGLVEVWYDHETGLYLNSRPYDAVIKGAPDRFALHILSYPEVHGTLQQAFDLIFRNCRPSLNVLLTVSPVPLSATFSGDDVAVANQYSKSVLRAAAEAIRREYPRVDYFPSYESVILSDRTLTWDDSMVHVHAAVVQANVDAMIAAYVPDQAASPPEGAVENEAAATASSPHVARYSAAQLAEKIADVRSLYRQRRFEEGVEAARSLEADSPGQSLRLVADGLIALERFAEVEALLTAALATSYKNAGTHGLLAVALEKQGRLAEALASAERAVSLGPDVTRWIATLARLLARSGRLDEACEILSRSAALHPGDRLLAAAEREIGAQSAGKPAAQGEG